MGLPECNVHLAHATLYCARAPKSIYVYKSLSNVTQYIQTHASPPVPLHLRNAPTGLMKSIGYSDGYVFNPEDTQGLGLYQTYLPPEVEGQEFLEEGEGIPHKIKKLN